MLWTRIFLCNTPETGHIFYGCGGFQLQVRVEIKLVTLSSKLKLTFFSFLFVARVRNTWTLRNWSGKPRSCNVTKELLIASFDNWSCNCTLNSLVIVWIHWKDIQRWFFYEEMKLLSWTDELSEACCSLTVKPVSTGLLKECVIYSCFCSCWFSVDFSDDLIPSNFFISTAPHFHS